MIGPQMGGGPPMPGFCPPPMMPDFSEFLDKPKKTNSSAPVIVKRSPQVNKTKEGAASSDDAPKKKTAKIAASESEDKDSKKKQDGKKKTVKGQVDTNIGPHVPAAAPSTTPNIPPPQFSQVVPPNNMQ